MAVLELPAWAPVCEWSITFREMSWALRVLEARATGGFSAQQLFLSATPGSPRMQVPFGDLAFPSRQIWNLRRRASFPADSTQPETQTFQVFELLMNFE